MHIIAIFKENNQKIDILKNLENTPSTFSQLHVINTHRDKKLQDKGRRTKNKVIGNNKIHGT